MEFTSPNEETPARRISTLVLMMFMGAMEVTAARTILTSSFPSMPDEADDPAWWARRTLARLADCGVTPDGWEEEFFLPFLESK